ncbi:hypothetical protein [Anaeromyxobacter dehalogenans]|uniref:hypothetical protein n=1 Tax=Anaeromyxobacter dehalogenans TaxID=161493 RepID=UPI00059D138B|nr:hypothetical protein [Anaeromyxobacter dehalogenans]
MTRRLTRFDYDGPGSFSRLLEAAYALADADSEDDVAYHRARCRFRAAVNSYADRRAAEKAAGEHVEQQQEACG